MFRFSQLVLITFLCSFSWGVYSEQMPESPAFKEARIEKDVNGLFKAVIVAAAKDLDDDQVMRPFALVKKNDGRTGLYQSDESEKNKDLSIVQQASALRNLLMDLANTNQITAYAQAMYATVSQENGSVTQGISVEIEHKDGVSLVRFLPVESILKNGETKLDFKLKNVSTAIKPNVVFNNSNT